MNRGWTIGKKLFLIGALALVALGFLAGNATFTNRGIKQTAVLTSERNRHLETVEAISRAQIRLMLAALGAISDRSSDTIGEDRSRTIDENVVFIRDNLATLDNLVDTTEEKAAVEKVRREFPRLSTGVQENLPALIADSAAARGQIAADFVRIVSEANSLGTRIEENLERITLSVREAQRAASEAVTYHTRQISSVNKLVHRSEGLMRAAAESLLDARSGALPGKWEEENVEAVDAISRRLKKMVRRAATEEEKAVTVRVSGTFARLAGTIVDELPTVIEAGASPAGYKRLRQDIDKLGNAVSQDLRALYSLYQDRKGQATIELDLRDRQLILLNDLSRHHVTVMLATMNVLLERDSGAIDEKRALVIDNSIGFLLSNIDDLDPMGDTEERRKSVTAIAESFPGLAAIIREELKAHVEDSARKTTEIQTAATEVIGDLNAAGEIAEDGLTTLRGLVKSEQVKAQEASDRMVDRSSQIGFISLAAAVALLLPAVFGIARSIVKPVRRVILGLHGVSDKLTGSSGLISSAGRNLADGASEQAASIEETSSSLEQMASMTRGNAANADEARKMMKQAAAIVARVDGQMEQMASAISEMLGSSSETNRIIKTIDEIAFQTNLLALNAAVEAARAGEAGAGFAVVADEVRNLAMRAATAAKDTAGRIENTIQSIENGARLTATTRESFQENRTITEKVGELVAEIAVASNEQAQGIEQINRAVADMDAVVQGVAASAEESASASEEMDSQAADLHAMVRQLSEVVSGTAAARAERAAGDATPSRRELSPSKPALELETGEISPRQVIPLDEDEFRDF